MYTKQQIEGMLIVLNKLYPKLEINIADFMIAEASDLPKLNGYFVVNKDTLEVTLQRERLNEETNDISPRLDPSDNFINH